MCVNSSTLVQKCGEGHIIKEGHIIIMKRPKGLLKKRGDIWNKTKNLGKGVARVRTYTKIEIWASVYK